MDYTPKNNNWNVDNVESALNDLYTNRINQNSFGTTRYASSVGDRIGKRTTTLEGLSKGKYIISVVRGTNWHNYATDWPTLATSDFDWGEAYDNLSCNTSSNCTIKKLGKYVTRVRPSAMYSGYQHYSAFNSMYYLEVKNSSVDLSSYMDEGADSTAGTSIFIVAVPIN